MQDSGTFLAQPRTAPFPCNEPRKPVFGHRAMDGKVDSRVSLVQQPPLPVLADGKAE